MSLSLSLMKCFLLFARFRRDEISSRDELIRAKKTGMKLNPGALLQKVKSRKEKD